MLANPSSGESAFAKTNATLSIFPGEEPRRAQLVEWLDESAPTLRRAGFGAAMSGRNPPHLIALSDIANMPDVAMLTDDERNLAGPLESSKHDQLTMKLTREKATAAKQFIAGLQDYHTRLASILETSLRPNASLRLSKLMQDHKFAGVDDSFNGGAMWREIVALRHLPSRLEDLRDHDRELEAMRDNFLPDGCTADDFAEKVNRLNRDHLEFLERPLAGAALGKFLIRLMPKCNTAEGTSLIRELTINGMINDKSYVIERCTEIVLLSATATQSIAAAATTASTESHPQVAALALAKAHSS